jgi:hypothetical protein
VIAGRQYRNITRQQLLGLGLSRDAIGRRVRKGALYRVHPGVYSVGGPPVTALERAYAAILAAGPNALLSHSSAMTLWGFYKRWDAPFEVTTPCDRRPKGITVHLSRTLATPDRDRQLGIPVTSPARTTLDIAPRLNDRLQRTVDGALLTPFLSRALLAEAIELHPGHPGTKLILPFITTADGPSRSGWEISFPDWACAVLGSRPIRNARVNGREVDNYFPEAWLIVELDSWEFHQTRTAFEDDRERDTDNLVHDIETMRLTWNRYYGAPQREADRLKLIYARRCTYVDART